MNHFQLYQTLINDTFYISASLRQPHLSLGQFRRALKRIYLTVSAGPSDFLFLGADYE